ncbi:uncharacterized protein LOC110649096 [Hevea brasiliensis]|uniref:uncharacterized protein LOC110649096 n=1 Tax=Hevea brasiliensis TaxID=3981 RepID=UPI0025CFDA16|nr:uncharacterized protein LOC110649096 [Hevea brasiliensis]
MGFRSLSDFNLALLGKQAWRLIQRPNSLEAKLFATRYYPSGVFFDATLGNNPSFVWRSVFSAKDFIKDNCCWRVGNREDIRVWSNPWLYGSNNPYVVTEMVEDLKNIRLKCVMKTDGLSWDEEVIQDKGMRSRFFKSLWGLVLDQILYQSSVLVWRRLRKSAIPPKVKNFIWRAILNILPTCSSLSGRRVDVFDVCPMCGGERETARIWDSGNKKVWKQQNISSSFVVSSARRYLLQWQDAQHLQLIDHASSLLRHQVKWSPPSVGRLKCNFDAATSCLHNRVATGWIIRGSAGQFLAAGFKTFEGGSNALQAEVLSFKEALNRVKNNNWGAVDFESDSMLLFQSFFNSFTDLSYVGVLIDDYHCFFKELGDSSLSFIRKSANQAAQCCTSVCSMSGSLEWSSTAPSFLEDVLNFDLNYCLNKSILFW